MYFGEEAVGRRVFQDHVVRRRGYEINCGMHVIGKGVRKLQHSTQLIPRS
jgi:hypothetical protein